MIVLARVQVWLIVTHRVSVRHIHVSPRVHPGQHDVSHRTELQANVAMCYPLGLGQPGQLHPLLPVQHQVVAEGQGEFGKSQDGGES